MTRTDRFFCWWFWLSVYVTLAIFLGTMIMIYVICGLLIQAVVRRVWRGGKWVLKTAREARLEVDA